jgi:hypothetical protein
MSVMPLDGNPVLIISARSLWLLRKNLLLACEARPRRLLEDGFFVDKRRSHVLKSKSIAVKEFTLNRCPA